MSRVDRNRRSGATRTLVVGTAACHRAQPAAARSASPPKAPSASPRRRSPSIARPSRRLHRRPALVDAAQPFPQQRFRLFRRALQARRRTVAKDPQGYVGLGASYDRLRRFDLSDRVYAALFQLTGGTAQYYNNVGYSYMLRGNLTAALTNFRKAKPLAPDSVVVANNLQIVANAVRRRAPSACSGYFSRPGDTEPCSWRWKTM